MRTVHEPEQPRGTTLAEPTPPGKKSIKLKLTNGSAKPPAPPLPADQLSSSVDEDGNPVDPSHPNDNITYIPAHHPITGQPGFMIHYPPDINFTAWESSIAADQLMRLLKLQLHWAQREGDELRRDGDELEKLKKEEWALKEILLDSLMEAELSIAERDNKLQNVDARVREVMHRDAEPAKHLEWTGGEPSFRAQLRQLEQMARNGQDWRKTVEQPDPGERTPEQVEEAEERTPSPPPTGKSGGFDGENDPYDNYLADRMAEYEERERQRSIQNTPQKSRVAEQQAADEADAVGALMGMSGKGSGGT